MNQGARSRDRLILRQSLREMRKEAGLCQAELAERLGRNQSFISNIEKGQRRVDILKPRKICAAYDIALVEFASCLEAKLTRA